MNQQNAAPSNGIKPLWTVILILAGMAGGAGIYKHWFAAPQYAQLQSQEASVQPEVLYWVAPMDPGFRRDEPGQSPMGMDLVPVYAGAEDDGDAVYISPAVVQNLGVRTAQVERRSLWRMIEATGYVGVDETLMRQVTVRTEGWIERLLVRNEGEQVHKGQVLFEFYSPQLVNAQKEYVQSLTRNETRLAQGGESKLLALGMEAADIQELARSREVTNTIKVLAPQDGTITHLNVREGIFVRPSTEILTLANLSSVWLQVEVFESQAGLVADGQSAEARLNYLPGEVFSGRVDYVYPILDPVMRTLPVRLRFDNPGERLKPNMYARVSIFGKSHPGALSVPREALIRGSNSDRLVISLGEGRFVAREVISGIESGEWVEIISGVTAGEEVVTSAQFLIDSEASLSGSIQRLEDSTNGQNPGREAVFVSGTVEAIDRGARRMRVSHGPIEDLGWAAMTMEFDVLPSVDLGSLEPGQSIHFELGQSEVGDYQIKSLIQPVASEDTSSRDNQK